MTTVPPAYKLASVHRTTQKQHTWSPESSQDDVVAEVTVPAPDLSDISVPLSTIEGRTRLLRLHQESSSETLEQFPIFPRLISPCAGPWAR
jgi:hypothetical protein